jgi:hypothetical protein
VPSDVPSSETSIVPSSLYFSVRKLMAEPMPRSSSSIRPVTGLYCSLGSAAAMIACAAAGHAPSLTMVAWVKVMQFSLRHPAVTAAVGGRPVAR